MKYLFNDKEISQNELQNYKPLEYSDDFQTIILRELTNEEKIAELKQKLAETDYKCLKFVDGELTQAEYAETWQKRKQWREEINKLEKEI